MRAFVTIIIILFVAAAIFFFTKPGDQECISQGKQVADAQTLAKTPGYENPMDETNGQTPSESIIVKDNFLWKEVDYTVKGEIKPIGYAYLGSFHACNQSKK
jgi:hypothetical protein